MNKGEPKKGFRRKEKIKKRRHCGKVKAAGNLPIKPPGF